MSTQERLIETPVGSKLGKIFEHLEVLGIGSFITQSGNLPNAKNLFTEAVDVEVPVGTVAVIPSPNLWLLGHGNLQPEFMDPLDENQHQLWNPDDHHWGAGAFQVSVIGVNAPDFSQNPPKQTAHLHVNMLLSDINGDDSWFGIAGYTLIYIGKPPRPGVVIGGTGGTETTGAIARTAPRTIWKGTKIR